MRRPALTVLLALAALLAACAGETATPTLEPTPEPTPSPTEEATPEPTAEETDGTGALPSFELPNSAPELAALLPDEIAGEQAFKLSMSGEEMMAAGGQAGVDPSFQAFLDEVGGDPSSISVAFAFGVTAQTNGVFAFRVEGADEDALLAAFRAAQDAESDETIDWESASIAGKDVLVGTEPESGTTMYLYVAQDIIFVVTATDEATAAEILTDLP
jgi:hypothetical protein